MSDWPKPAKNAVRNLYVIELGDVKTPRTTPLPCVYVGQSVYPPAIRFEQHQKGYKAARVVRKHGKRLRADLSTGVAPVRDWQVTLDREAKLAARLGEEGYCVHGGH